tara:strand:- start:1519 stop:1704 length:186 start_codon:yes stop_codon:yes gene_type:complete
MTTEQDLLFDELYEEVEPRLHEALDDEIEALMNELNLPVDIAKRLIETFYYNEIKKENGKL